MSTGQPSAPILLEAFAKNATVCTPAAPVAGGKTSPFPKASQIGITNGAASLDDGFTVQNMTDPAAGGVPPYGVDMNGILYLLSAQVAALGAGQAPPFSATLAAAMGGYQIGAQVAFGPGGASFFMCVVDGATDDPNAGASVNWRLIGQTSFNQTAIAAGTYNDFGGAPDIGASDGMYALGATASGNITITGIGRSGFASQRVAFFNNNLTPITGNLIFRALNTGSASGNRIQCVDNLTLTPGQSQEFEWVQLGADGVWIPT